MVWSSGGKTPNFREEGKLPIALWRNYERLGPVTTPDLLAIANLFGRENSYGVAREGKLHCNEEGKLLIVCQVEGKLQKCRDK